MSNSIMRSPISFFDMFGADPFEGMLDTMSLRGLRHREANPLNMVRRSGGHEIEVSVPGYSKSDIEVDVKDDVLTISGKREQLEKDAVERYHIREFETTSFTRTIRLPTSTDIDAISATCKDGILKIYLPSHKEKRPRQIEIG